DLVEPFDPARYNIRATVAENLLFGVPTSPGLMGRALIENEVFRGVLDRAELTDDFLVMGVRIAETMTDIFRGLPSGHPLFDQFSFVHADELAEFERMVKRSRISGRGGLTRDERLRLLALPLAYVEPRHRLGLLDDALRERLLEARGALRQALEEQEDPGVEFYDPDRVNTAAPVRDNLLFGRVNESVAAARDTVRELGAKVIQEMDLSGEIERVGLDHEVGPAGRLLTPTQRASVSLIRSAVKRPDILVVDGAFAPFGERRVEALILFLAKAMEGRTLIVVLPNERNLTPFDLVIRFENKAVVLEPGPGPALPAEPAASEPQVAAEAAAPAITSDPATGAQEARLAARVAAE
ncbi:MAG: multidrug transporter ATP-binding protein, partial [Enterovirga sp.]|nr:multidrug transporter ATP-binding protein [Enterovirga sp.]